MALIDDDPGKTPSILSMEVAGLPYQLNGRTTARHAELSPCLSEMGFHRCGGQSETICDLRRLKMIGDAFEAATFLRRETAQTLDDPGRGNDGHRLLRPIVSRPWGGL